MPKLARSRVAWSGTHQTYLIEEHGKHAPLAIAPDSSAWFTWLDQISSFAFRGRVAHCTARKEHRPRGEGYWYAYLGVGKKLSKRYLGKTTDLTLARLEQVASELQVTSDQGEARRRARHGAPTPTPALAPVVAQASASSAPAGDGSRSARPSLHLAQAPEPSTPLLASKLQVPRLRAHFVPRSHLIERLQRSLECPLTLLSAPAGFGKTTLLATWLAQSGTPGAWLALEPEDNEPVRFFSCVLAALQRLYPALGSGTRALLNAPQPVPLERVLALLVNEFLASETGELALVLDDYHLIEADAIHKGMAFLLDRLPARLHLILATRADPPLPLARLRARGHLVEVRAADLRFDESETATFLQAVMGIELSAAEVATLVQRTEGWIAGLQLAALSLQGSADTTGFLAAFTGSHRFVLDYLSEEVLSQQPVSVQRFLVHTSILERLSGPLCDAVMGREDSQARLESLERANLFLVPLDDERRWYRYHHLLRDVLRSRLQREQPSLAPGLHRRAGAWYLQQGQVAEAIHHLLSVGDVERVADVIESRGFSLGAGSGERIRALHGWLTALPEPLVRARPMLCLLHAHTFMAINRPREAEALLQEAERREHAGMPAEEACLIQGCAATIRANLAGFTGDVAQAVAFAQQALGLLPETDLFMRPTARMVLAHRYFLDGDVTAENERLIVEVAAFARSGGNSVVALNILTALARFQYLQGRLHQAAATYGEVAAMIPNAEALQALPGSASYYFGLGDILREWNELAEAERLLSESIRQVQGPLAVPHEVVTQGYVSLARVQLAQSDYQAARETLRAFEHLAREQQFLPAQEAHVAATGALVELAQGNLAEAVRWADTHGAALEEQPFSFPHEQAYLALVRVRIAQGRQHPTGPWLERAVRMVDGLLADAEAKERLASTLEGHVVQALALQAQAHETEALAALEHALALAEPEGYVRLFADEGPPMAALLAKLQAQGRGSANFLQTLRLACEPPTQHAPALQGVAAAARGVGAAGPPAGPLSERERDVLKLVAEGVSNAEIAEHLVIEVSTVKRHMSNILAKLDASNRTHAVARARALGILP